MRAPLFIAAFATLPFAALADAPYFSELAGQAPLNAQMLAQAEGQESWVGFLISKGGVESAGKTIDVDGQPHVFASTCRPHMCSDYQLAAIVAPNGDLTLYAYGDEVRDGVLKDASNSIKGAFLMHTQP